MVYIFPLTLLSQGVHFAGAVSTTDFAKHKGKLTRCGAKQFVSLGGCKYTAKVLRETNASLFIKLARSRAPDFKTLGAREKPTKPLEIMSIFTGPDFLFNLGSGGSPELGIRLIEEVQNLCNGNKMLGG